MNIRELIVKTALKYEGQEEIKGNMGFKDEEFDRKMRAMGFQDTHAWCAYFAELVWKEAYQQYNSFLVDALDNLFSASAVQTFRNFRDSLRWEVSTCAEMGDVVIWQTYKNGKAHWTGHAAIVVGSEHKTKNFTEMVFPNGKFMSIEGNTNSSGGREGIEVALKSRINNIDSLDNGLRVMGFIKPIE